MNKREDHYRQHIAHTRHVLDDWRPERIKGRVLEASGQFVRASLPRVGIGEVCRIDTQAGGGRFISAEVAALSSDQALLAPLGDLRGMAAGASVLATGQHPMVEVGPWMLGCTVDSEGKPLNDDLNPVPKRDSTSVPLYRAPPSPLSRPLIDRPAFTGVRAIDGLLLAGQGQRFGIFASAGTGKSTLLGMIARGTNADVVVCALIGERGREVREFIENELTPETMAHTVIVAATSDRSAMERIRAAYAATAIAEYFRDRGQHVLLLFDSLTRFARGLREVGLAAGEPAVRRGFPPSVFARLPQLVERTGRTRNGAITAFYTVLVEGEEQSDPVAEESKSLLDGHIILTSDLVASAHYPAIDILQSVSRCMKLVADPLHARHAAQIRRLMARYKEVELLVRIGEYERGADPSSDDAIDKIDAINRFLRQPLEETVDFATCREQMTHLLGEVRHA